VIVVAALAGLLARRLGDRLRRVDDAAGLVAAGDLTARVEDEGDDEVSHLADSFNEMAQQLEAAAKREQDFLLNVGHDLRTPLTSIAGYAETLADGKVGEHELPGVAAALQRQSIRLSRLVEDLMLLARLEAREFSLRPEPVDLGGLVRGVAEEYRARAGDASVRLEIDTDSAGAVEVDPVRVSQIVSNLVENALRYAPEGGDVRVFTRVGGGQIVISVSDTGPGIDPGDIPRVFERLYVAQRYRAVRPEGSGLGLSIVHELVTAMGGVVEVASQPGEGTTVTVRLAE
jgi:two-component system sensor histidine kinase BaeS